MMNGLLLAATHGNATGWPLTLVLALAAAVSAVLLGLAVAAFQRRRSRPYLLIVAALAALVGQPIVGGLNATGALGQPTHHLIEHALDVLLAALVVGAVWYARGLEPEGER